MYIKSLSLKNYRNYEYIDICFSKHVNILYGNNAQGKTNLVEAIYLCSTSKSHRTNIDKELINFNASESHIKAIINKDGIDQNIDVHLKHNKKGIAINRIPIRKLTELIGISNVIIFSPEDMGLIKSGPKERRKFINLELCKLDNIYYYNLKQYQKILKHRNNLLKVIKFNKDRDTLSVWDNQLINYGKKIIKLRKKFIEELNTIVSSIHFDISGKQENLEIIYENNIGLDEYEKYLIKNIDKDIKFGTTSIGPHRDDLKFCLNGIDLRKYGSQGQQRTAVLSLKLSEIKLVTSKINNSPILLLDDVLSELDANRQKYLLKFLKNIQTIITCTGVEDYVKNYLKIEKLYKVNSGHIYCE